MLKVTVYVMERVLKMLKLNVSGTKNDLKTFQKWFKKALDNKKKFEIGEETEFIQNKKNKKYYRYEADLIRPLKENGGKQNVQSNSGSQSKGWGWKNHYHS